MSTVCVLQGWPVPAVCVTGVANANSVCVLQGWQMSTVCVLQGWPVPAVCVTGVANVSVCYRGGQCLLCVCYRGDQFLLCVCFTAVASAYHVYVCVLQGWPVPSVCIVTGVANAYCVCVLQGWPVPTPSLW